MNKTITTKNSNNRLVISLMILGLFVLLMSGCQQTSTPVNSNTATNSNTTANTNANSNANTAQTFKNDLVGTWIGVDDPKKKVTFTADEMTLFEDGKENKLKYTRLSNDEIEVVFEGTKRKVKTTFEGDLLTIIGDETVKFKRESANSNANANTSVVPTNSATNTTAAPKEEVPLTEAAKVFKNNLVGEWNDGKETLIFTEDKLENRTAKKILPYRIVDEKTVEFTSNEGTPAKATMTFEDNGNTLVWFNHNAGRTFKFWRVNPK